MPRVADDRSAQNKNCFVLLFAGVKWETWVSRGVLTQNLQNDKNKSVNPDFY
jgi:hypothetical protein